MKPIKIVDTNHEKIQKALDAANGKASSLTIARWKSVVSVAASLEKRLEVLSKADRKGASAVYVPSGPSNAYKYRAISTRLRMSRRATGWFLDAVERTEIYPSQSEIEVITITEAQCAEIQRRSVASFIVAK